MSEGKTFFSTIPGILTGLAALITAVTGMVFALSEIGVFEPNGNTSTNTSVQQTQTSSKPTTDGWAIIGKYKSGRFFDLKLMVHGDSPAIGRHYDVVDDFRLVQKRLKRGEYIGQTITLGKVHRGDSVELVDIYVKSPSTEVVPVWAKLRTELHKR